MGGPAWLGRTNRSVAGRSTQSSISAAANVSDVRTNGAHDLDASVFNYFTLGGERILRLKIFSYNVTNSVQFGYPNVFWNPSPMPANMSGFGDHL
jgi:hypothetical protein